MGEVYRAIHTRIGRGVALKVLSLTNQDSKFAQRFLNEARIHAGLHHPNIVTLYDFLEVDGKPCIVMEYVDGITLAEHLRIQGPLPLSEAAFIFQRIVEAIKYIHDHGVVHRDIKSGNIKISTRHEVKLLDFGIAKDAYTPALTREGNFVGTMQYLAPEQLRGTTAGDRSSDIWALGVLLYEMVTGQLPFESETVADCFRKITSGHYPPPESLNPALPGEARTIIDRCLQKKPTQRYATAQDLWEATERLATVVSTPRLITTAQGTQAGLKGHKLIAMMRDQWLLWGVGMALVALIAMSVRLAWQTGASEPPDKPAVSSRQHPLSPSIVLKDISIPYEQPQGRVPVHIDTHPSGADVYRDGSRIATTPWDFNEPVGSRVKAVLKRKGFEDKEIDFQVNQYENRYTPTLEKSSRR